MKHLICKLVLHSMGVSRRAHSCVFLAIGISRVQIPCSGHRRLYLARLPEHIIGGCLDGTGHIVRERLAIYLVTTGVDVFPREIFMRDCVLGARFFWVGAAAPYMLRGAVINMKCLV